MIVHGQQVKDLKEVG